ncbi:hypothetical protein JCM10908_002370 [Rhodotorula pacifica]|uniref:uncharacterized protein n=1 Tax=Rhodotorula pacifica TaxID=1495444 RepID=UPI00316C317F
MSRFYSSSLVPRHWHDADLVELMQMPLSEEMISFVAARTMDAIKCRPPPQLPPSPPVTPGERPKSSYTPDHLPPLDYFIHSILIKSRCHVPTLLCTLVYLERLKRRLPTHARGCHTTRHRVFLAVLIVAAKYLNDSSPQNKHWQRYAAFFQLSEITLMERQLLTILNFDLNFTEEELIGCLGTLLRPEPQQVDVPSVEAPVLPAGPAAVPSVDEVALAAGISASIVDAELLERGSSAKRKRMQARPPSPPTSEEEEVEELDGGYACAHELPARRPSYPIDRSKRLTPEYSSAPPAPVEITRPPTAAGCPRATVPAEKEEVPVDMPSAPPLALRRPPLRSFLLRSSSISQPAQPPRVQSWASQESTSSPSTTYRSSIMSSCSSTSTVSSTSSGPQTPPTPLDDEPVAKLPLSFANLALAGKAHPQPEVVHLADESVSPVPTPSLINVLASQPDFWPLMMSSAVSTKDARSMSATAQKQRARLIESTDVERRRGSSLISV